MNFPATGALILLIGIAIFLFSPHSLYAATIILIPFSATAVVNVHWGGEDKGVAAWLFLAFLCFSRKVLSNSPPWRGAGWALSRPARNGLFVFFAAVLVSLCVPLVLNGTSFLPDPNPISNQTVPLRFSLYNVTQTAYLGLGVLLTVFVASETCNKSELFRTLKLYVASCSFVAAWGIFQLWCNVSGHDYPAWLFNTSADASALGYLEMLPVGTGSWSRVSSVALEPSVLAEELLLAFVILLVSLSLGHTVLSKKWDSASMALIGCALVVCTSSTAYVGVLVALFIAGIALSRADMSPRICYGLGIAGMGIAIVMITAIPMVRQLASVSLFDKFDTGSGIGRVYAVDLAARDFLRFPIFGAGWHAVDSWDLVFLILANTGIVGFIAFVKFIIPIVRELWRCVGKRKPTALIVFPAVIVVLVLAEIAGLTYSAGYVWLAFGLGIGALIVAAREEPIALSPDKL